jgi:hypothetical protein
MDSFELIAAKAVDSCGLWTRLNYCVNITKQDKIDIENKSRPRPEIDILAFNVKKNEVILFECKSYLDSRGIRSLSFSKPTKKKGPRPIQIFWDPAYRNLVLERLNEQLFKEGLISCKPTYKLGLICGRIVKKDEANIRRLFKAEKWILVSPKLLRKAIHRISALPYENHIVTVMAKILK